MYPAREESIRIALVDDQTLLCEGLEKLLQSVPDIKISNLFKSGEQIIDFIKDGFSQLPDILLLEARMPGIGSIETARLLLEARPQLKIIAMSSVASGVIPSQLLRLGVQGYITKRIDFEEFCKAIRLVQAGQRYVSSEVATKLAIDPFSQQGALFDKLSKREIQIAQMLTEGKKVTQISGFLDLSPKTVYSYRYRIFEKLGIRSDVELTILAVRHGLTDDNGDVAELTHLQRLVS